MRKVRGRAHVHDAVQPWHREGLVVLVLAHRVRRARNLLQRRCYLHRMAVTTSMWAFTLVLPSGTNCQAPCPSTTTIDLLLHGMPVKIVRHGTPSQSKGALEK